MEGTLRWVVLFFLLLFGLWYINGGPEKEEAKNPFIKNANKSGIGETYNKPIKKLFN